MSRIYISDTNIWIDFSNAGLLNELFQLPLTFCCTEFVLDELNNFDHSALLARRLLVEPLDDTAVIKLYVSGQHYRIGMDRNMDGSMQPNDPDGLFGGYNAVKERVLVYSLGPESPPKSETALRSFDVVQ